MMYLDGYIQMDTVFISNLTKRLIRMDKPLLQILIITLK